MNRQMKLIIWRGLNSSPEKIVKHIIDRRSAQYRGKGKPSKFLLRMTSLPLLLSILMMASCFKDDLGLSGGYKGCNNCGQIPYYAFGDTMYIHNIRGINSIRNICNAINYQNKATINDHMVGDYSYYPLFDFDYDSLSLGNLLLEMKRQEPRLDYFFTGTEVTLMFRYGR